MGNNETRNTIEEEGIIPVEESSKAMKIIETDPDGNLKFLGVDSLLEIKGDILIWGILGKTRQGKSTSMNILYELLTTTPGEPFAARDDTEPVTKGIWLKLVTWEMMSPDIREQFTGRGLTEVNVGLWDCEGMEAGDPVTLAKLYLITLLASHVCSIHTTKIIDQTFKNTLQLSFMWCEDAQILDYLKTHLRIILRDRREALPQNYLEQAFPEDNTKDPIFKSILNWFTTHSSVGVFQIAPPPTDDDGDYIINRKESNYWGCHVEMLKTHLLSLSKGNSFNIEMLQDFIKNCIQSFQEKNFAIIKAAADMLNEHKHNAYKDILKEYKNYLIDQIRQFNIEILPTLTHLSELEVALKAYLNNNDLELRLRKELEERNILKVLQKEQIDTFKIFKLEKIEYEIKFRYTEECNRTKAKLNKHIHKFIQDIIFAYFAEATKEWEPGNEFNIPESILSGMIYTFVFGRFSKEIKIDIQFVDTFEKELEYTKKYRDISNCCQEGVQILGKIIQELPNRDLKLVTDGHAKVFECIKLGIDQSLISEDQLAEIYESIRTGSEGLKDKKFRYIIERSISQIAKALPSLKSHLKDLFIEKLLTEERRIDLSKLDEAYNFLTIKGKEEITILLEGEGINEEEFSIVDFVKDLKGIKGKVVREINVQKRIQKVRYEKERERTKKEKFKIVNVEFTEEKEIKLDYSHPGEYVRVYDCCLGLDPCTPGDLKTFRGFVTSPIWVTAGIGAGIIGGAVGCFIEEGPIKTANDYGGKTVDFIAGTSPFHKGKIADLWNCCRNKDKKAKGCINKEHIEYQIITSTRKERRHDGYTYAMESWAQEKHFQIDIQAIKQLPQLRIHSIN